MSFTIGLAQCRHHDDRPVLESVAMWARKAAAAGVDLLVFPEALMTRFDGSIDRFVEQAQPADGPFASAVNSIAASEKIWIAYTMNERNEAGGLPFNTALIADDGGTCVGRYRKVHLFDAQGYRESDRMAAGDELMAPVQAPFATIGLGICYDLRFPETSLAAALAGAQLMLFPAAWVSGTGKVDQWRTLLRARAIENGMFVAGVSSCDEDRIGHSCVFGPDGTPRAVSDTNEEQLLICTIDAAEITRVREATPSLLHRRPECYRRASSANTAS